MYEVFDRESCHLRPARGLHGDKGKLFVWIFYFIDRIYPLFISASTRAILLHVWSSRLCYSYVYMPFSITLARTP